jgi:hypothetical protein
MTFSTGRCCQGWLCVLARGLGSCVHWLSWLNFAWFARTRRWMEHLHCCIEKPHSCVCGSILKGTISCKSITAGQTQAASGPAGSISRPKILPFVFWNLIKIIFVEQWRCDQQFGWAMHLLNDICRRAPMTTANRRSSFGWNPEQGIKSGSIVLVDRNNRFLSREPNVALTPRWFFWIVSFNFSIFCLVSE